MKIWILNVLNTLKKCLLIRLNIHIYWSSPREKEVNEPEMKNKKSIAWMRWDGKEDPPTATRTTTTHWTKRVVFLFIYLFLYTAQMQPAGTYLNGDRSQICLTPCFFLFLKKKKKEKKETKIPTLDSYTHYYNYKHLFPKHDHRRKEKKEKRKKKKRIDRADLATWNPQL